MEESKVKELSNVKGNKVKGNKVKGMLREMLREC